MDLETFRSIPEPTSDCSEICRRISLARAAIRDELAGKRRLNPSAFAPYPDHPDSAAPRAATFRERANANSGWQPTATVCVSVEPASSTERTNASGGITIVRDQPPTGRVSLLTYFRTDPTNG